MKRAPYRKTEGSRGSELRYEVFLHLLGALCVILSREMTLLSQSL